MHLNRHLNAFLLLAGFIAGLALAQEARAQRQAAQERPSGTRIQVPVDKIEMDDGDTITIDWSDGDRERVRILGIDTPEIQHADFNIPYEQPFGREAAGFAAGAFAVAQKVELLRAAMKDPYGRTLGYIFLDGRNYSVLVLKARLAVETVSHYGDNGLPEEADAGQAEAG